MASIPGEFVEKRRVLYGRGQEKAQRAAVEGLLREGRLAESLEYLERIRDAGLLGRVRAAAVEAGDAFSLQRACQILREDASPDDWRSLGERAERKERYYDAIRAFEKAGDPDRSESVRQAHHPDYAPFKPQGK